MKASELIEKLAALKEQFGDLEVEIWTRRQFYNHETREDDWQSGFFPIEEVSGFEKGNKRSFRVK